MPSLSKSLKAYGGWSSALLSGILIGFGVLLLIVMRMLVETFGTVGDPHAYADVQLWGTFLIIFGVVLGAVGIYEISSSLKTVSPQPSITTLEGKKYCRYCRTENKSDAVFCEKCGKKID